MAPLKSSWKVLPLALLLGSLLGSVVVTFARDRCGLALPLSALCSLAVLWTTARRVRVTFPSDPRRALVLALGASSVTVFLAVWLHVVHVRQPWVESTFSPRDRREPSAWLLLPATASMLCLPLAIAVVEGVVTSLLRPIRPVVRALVPLLAVAVTALSFAGLARAWTRPAPRSPVAGLPVVATFTAPEAAGVTEHHPVGGLTMTVACVQSYGVRCHVLLRRDEASLPRDWPVDVRRRPFDLREESYARPGASLRVLRDERHDLWVVQSPSNYRHDNIAAFRGPSLARVNLGLRDFPGEFAPFVGWPVAALLGVALAVWFIRRARFVDPLPPGPLADATLRADGTLLLADGSTRPALRSAAMPVGPVVVAASHAPAPYRDNTPVAVVRAGTLARWTDALRDERDVRHALAFSTLVLLGTPMFFAAWLRLLW